MLVTVGGSTPCRRAPKHHTVCSAPRHSMTWRLLCLQPHSQSSYFSASSGQTTKKVKVKCQWSLFFPKSLRFFLWFLWWKDTTGDALCMRKELLTNMYAGANTITSWKYCSKLSTRLSKLAYVRIKHHSTYWTKSSVFLNKCFKGTKASLFT